MGAVDIVIVQNIASDAAWIIEHRLRDKRRSAPFERLAERTDSMMPGELETVLERTIVGLREKSPAVAEEIEECVVRLRQELARR